MFRLPVSGAEIELRTPSGAEDLFLLETTGTDTEVALGLVSRTARRREAEPDSWGDLPACDLDAVLLLLRRMVFGDVIATGVRCPKPECNAPVDVDFRISEYLAHHRGRSPRNVEVTEMPGWYRLRGECTLFRIPTVDDQKAALHHHDPVQELARRCIQPQTMSRRTRRVVEAALESLAPSLTRTIETRCPECGSKIPLDFDVASFVLQELRKQARFLYEDVHLLASSYHWNEDEILQLPSTRRSRYAEMVLEARRVN
jgi:hypothetical protein